MTSPRSARCWTRDESALPAGISCEGLPAGVAPRPTGVAAWAMARVERGVAPISCASSRAPTRRSGSSRSERLRPRPIRGELQSTPTSKRMSRRQHARSARARAPRGGEPQPLLSGYGSCSARTRVSKRGVEFEMLERHGQPPGRVVQRARGRLLYARWCGGGTHSAIALPGASARRDTARTIFSAVFGLEPANPNADSISGATVPPGLRSASTTVGRAPRRHAGSSRETGMAGPPFFRLHS